MANKSVVATAGLLYWIASLWTPKLRRATLSTLGKKVMSLHRSAWWSLELPAGWIAQVEESCHTLLSEHAIGALQVSAYRKETESVSDDELREFAGPIPLRAVAVGDFTGFRTRCSEDGIFWIKWWLRADMTMVHISYNCALEKRSEEEEALVEDILNSLSTS